MPPISARTATAERTAWALPWLVLLVGSLAAVAGAQWLHDEQRAAAEAEFRHHLAQVSAEITERFHRPLYGLYGAMGFRAPDDKAVRAAFGPCGASPEGIDRFPGLSGLGCVERDPPTDFADAADVAEAAGRQSGVAPPDLAGDPVRRAALLQALDSGQPTLSGAISLGPGSSHGPAMLLLVPVPAGPASTADGIAPAASPGLVYASLVVSDLLADLAATGAGELHVRLFDSADGSPTGPLLFDSAAGVGGARAPESVRHRAVSALSLPGRQVTVEVRSTPAFEARTGSRAPERFAAGVAGATLLLSLILHRQASGRRRAEALMRRMTADLERLELIARRTANAVVFTDVERRITWVNEGFERITGYGAAEVVGQSPGRLLQTADTDAATVRRLRAALDAGQGFSGEILNRGKDGRTYWLALDIRPLHDEAGVLTGFMAVELDVTARRALEDEVRRTGGRPCPPADRPQVRVATADTIAPDPRSFDLDEVLRSVGASRSAAVGAKPVTVRLDVEPARAAAAAGPRRLDGLRLLVAEDDVGQQQIARRLLEAEGAEVHIADDGAEAVCAVATADPPFDGVLMDLQMPVMDGFTATARIRQDLGLATLPIVAVTACETASDQEAWLASGMCGQLGKPLDPDQLVAVLRRLTGRGVAAEAGAQ